MCGLWGVVGAPVSPAAAAAATAALRHRGPDDHARAGAGELTPGSTRLSLLDLQNGRQPLEDADGQVVAACNGEIYNFRDLRADLEARGHRFRTSCDAEVLPALYLEHGD